jgi:hypothetical protein
MIADFFHIAGHHQALLFIIQTHRKGKQGSYAGFPRIEALCLLGAAGAADPSIEEYRHGFLFERRLKGMKI